MGNQQKQTAAAGPGNEKMALEMQKLCRENEELRGEAHMADHRSRTQRTTFASEFREAENRVKQLEAELKARARAIEELENQIRQVPPLFQKPSDPVADQSRMSNGAGAASRGGCLISVQKHIACLEDELDLKETEIAQKDTELQQKDAEIKRLQQLLAGQQGLRRGMA